MPPAKITDRFIAYLIDTVPFALGFYLTVCLMVLRWGQPNDAGTRREALWLWAGAYLAYQALGNALGATAGKRLLGLRVTGADQGRLTLGRAVLRSLGLAASTPLFNAGYLWALVDSRSRAWHDLLAGSLVVEARPKTRRESVANAALAFVLLGLVAGAGTWPLWGTTPQDRAALERAWEGLKVLARIEEAYKARHGEYTDQLVELARSSGDASEFKAAMGELFDPRGIRIAADKDRYFLSARALDRRRTPVSLAGP